MSAVPRGAPKLCVLGGEGLLGRALRRRAAAAGVVCTNPGRVRADVRRCLSLRHALEQAAPDLVINAAAFTDVDRAELDREAAFAVNRDGAANVARVCADAGLPLVHVSTDQVFDGRPGRPLAETDPTGPLGVYGASKLAGEHAVSALHPAATIVRSAWLYDEFEPGFVRAMLRLAGERDRLQVVADHRGSPTHVDDLADGLLALARRLLLADTPRAGIYHLAGPAGVTRHGWIAALLEEFAVRTGRRVTIEPVTSRVFPVPAPRPADSTLDCTLVERHHGIRLPDFRARLGTTVRGGLAPLAATA